MALNSPLASAIRPVAPDDRRCTRAAGRPLGGSHPRGDTASGVGDDRAGDASEGMQCSCAEKSTL
jgi:hypothetical protein